MPYLFTYFVKRYFRNLLIVLFLLTGSQELCAQSWQSMGKQPISEMRIWYPATTVSPDGVRYLVYQDESKDDWATVMVYNGIDWEQKGKKGISGREVENISITCDKMGIPYIAFTDKYYLGQASVMKWADSTWEYCGLDRFTTGAAHFVSLAIHPDGTPFVAFSEFDSAMELKVLKFNGKEWEKIGDQSFIASSAFNCDLKFDTQGNLFVAYSYGLNNMSAKVMKFFENKWTPISSNPVSTGIANFISLGLNQKDELFISYSDENNFPHVKKFNGNNWTEIGKIELPITQALQSSFIPGKDIFTLAYSDENFSPSVISFIGNRWEFVNQGLDSKAILFPHSLGFDGEDSYFMAYIDPLKSHAASARLYNGVLPVVWLNFTGKKILTTAQLNWATSSEQNNDRFEIERSIDGKVFSKIGSVKGAGNSTNEKSYVFLDKSPILGAINFYRLKQFNFDGSHQLSKIISLNFKESNTPTRIYPNPTKDNLNILFANSQKEIHLKIFNTQGQLKWQQTLHNTGLTVQVPLQNWSAGFYRLVIEHDGGQKESLNFIKQ